MIKDTTPTDTPSDEPSAEQAWLRCAASAAISMLGVFLVGLSDVNGRSGHSSGLLYWSGSVVVVLAVAPQILFARRVAKAEGVAVAAIIAAATYLVKFVYSPLALVFGDEYQHFATATALQHTGALFSQNNGLPISPDYPGLELVNSSISFCTGLSVVDSSYVLTAVLHIVTTVGLFALYQSLTGKPRLSLIALAVYTTGGDYLFFNDYFSYETIGVAFTVLALWALRRSYTTSHRRVSWACVATFFGEVVVVSHHVSSYLLILLALGLGLAHCFVDKRQLGPTSAFLAILVVSVLAWDGAVAAITRNYISTAIRQLLSNPASSPVSPSIVPNTPVLAPPTARGASLAQPHYEKLIEYAWAGCLLLLLAAGILMALRVFRSRPRSPETYFSIFSAVAVTAFVLRIVSPGGGGELGTRLLSFLLIPAALPIASALIGLAALISRRGLSHLRGSVIAGGLSVLQVGGLVAGWPPYYARIPGPLLAGGRMRGISQAELAMGEWAQSHIPEGSRVVADEGSATVLSGYSNAVVISSPDVAPFFLDNPLTPVVRNAVLEDHPDYVVVNLGLIDAPVVSTEDTFPGDPFVGDYGAHLNAAPGLMKFGHLPWLTEVFTDGQVELFRVNGEQPDAPSGG